MPPRKRLPEEHVEADSAIDRSDYASLCPRTELNMATIRQIVKKIKNGVTMSVVSASLLITHATIYRWHDKGERYWALPEKDRPKNLKIYGIYVLAIRRAVAEYQERITDGVHATATNPYDKDRWRQYLSIGERRMPQTWGKQGVVQSADEVAPDDQFL